MRKKSFWERVDKNGPVAPGMESKCWLWVGATRGGYGRLVVNGATKSAHVVAYEEAYGHVPFKFNGKRGRLRKRICHRCDVRRCVRPDHLFVGTQRVNVLDAVQKRRHKHPVYVGESHPLAKLTAASVELLRENAAGGSDRTALAKFFGISLRHCNRIIRGDRWKGPVEGRALVRGYEIKEKTDGKEVEGTPAT
jgi:hypothetical protein